MTRSRPDLNSFADHFGSIVAKPNFSATSNFESSTYKKKNFDLLGARAGQTRGRTGAPNPNLFNWYEIGAPKSIQPQILEVLAI